MLKITVKVGNAELEMSSADAKLQDFIREAGVLLDMDTECGLCKDTALGVTTRKVADGTKFTEFFCKKCGARRPWGSYKDGSGFFLKPWEPKYEKPTA
jgi:hypothetical protein